MELFLLFLWMKIEVISFFVGLCGLLFLFYWVYLVVSTNNKWDVDPTKSISFDKWKETETGRRKVYLYGKEHAVTLAAFEEDLKYTSTFKANRWLIAPAIVLLLVAGLIPSKQEIAVLVGGSYALDVAKSPEAAKLMTVIRGKANEILDGEIKKLEEKK